MKTRHHLKSANKKHHHAQSRKHSHHHHHNTHRHRRKHWVLNPFRQEDEDEVLAKRTHNRRRWSHVFPLGEAEFVSNATARVSSLRDLMNSHIKVLCCYFMTETSRWPQLEITLSTRNFTNND